MSNDVRNDVPEPASVSPVELPSVDDGVLYDAYYYQNCCGLAYQRDERNLAFFGAIAERIVRAIAPRTAIDAGCALGMLVESLRDRGVDAEGIDISPFAISQVREDLAPFCRVGSVLEPFPRPRYDLVISMEVVEHLPFEVAEEAVANLCRHSDDVILTSSPLDFREVTHQNVRPPEYWAGLFALHGYFRDFSVDVSFIMPWAQRFRRARDPIHHIVVEYERELWHRVQQVRGLREAVDIEHRVAEELEEAMRVAQHLTRHLDEMRRQLNEMESALAETQRSLGMAQHSLGEAERALAATRAERDLSVGRLQAAEAHAARMERSLSWRITRPMRFLRQLTRRGL